MVEKYALFIENLQIIKEIPKLGGSAKLPKNELGSGMGSGSQGYGEEYGNDFEKQVCQIKKGDTLIEQSKLPVPNVIKIDAEGMEMDVLEGLAETLKNKTCKYVFCEIHTRLNPALYSDVCNYLKQRGFKMENIYVKKEGIGTVGIR